MQHFRHFFGYMRGRFSKLGLLLFFTLAGFLVMGYHPGFEDDGVYLPAIKADLNPHLYPHDAAFFQVQMQATLFPQMMAAVVRLTHLPLAWAELLAQWAALFVILWASRRIAAHLFTAASAQWGAVAMVAAMFTLPVAGTALNIADQHLHPRNLATALILVAVSRILDARRGQAVGLVLVAFLIHPVMAALGASFCVFLMLAQAWPSMRWRVWRRTTRERLAGTTVALAAPLAWLFAPESAAWRQAFAARSYYSIYRWHWYEWLGALAPLALFALLARLASRRSQNEAQSRLANFALAVFAYGLFQQIVAMALLAPPSLARLAPLQPMRYLHLIYLFMALVAGGLLGQFVIKTSPWRWAVYLLLFNGSMFAVQWELIDDGAHLELPGRATTNPWLQAFDWVRLNTPTDAYFALDPQYLAAPGEGFHGFRAVAERSQLADAIKDTSVVIQVPSLATAWSDQQQAQAGWERFKLADFERLKTEFGVDWVLVANAQTAGLDCRWHNGVVAACRVP